MLDDDQRIAVAGKRFQRFEKSRVIARMEADGRLVEDVEHPPQIRAKLGSKADALRLAAAQRVGGAVKGKIVQARPDKGSAGAG